MYEPGQSPHFVATDLGLHYLPLFHRKDAWLIWVYSRGARVQKCQK